MMDQLLRSYIKFAQLVDGSGIEVPRNEPTGDTFSSIMSVVFGILGVICVLVIALAGLQYVLSGGDPQKTAKAKNTILYAVIGLAVAIVAGSIVNFVFNNTGL